MSVAHKGGFTLIEVLAALALVSAGVIGFLHTQQLREATEIELLSRSRAAMLTSDVVRKIAVNPAALDRYRTALGSPPALTADCRRVACSRGALAAFHLAHWKCRLGRWAQHASCRDVLKTRALLPGGDGRVEPQAGGVRVTVRWLGADGKPQALETHHALLPR